MTLHLVPTTEGRPDLVLKRASETGAINDPVIRQEIARLHSLVKANEFSRVRAADEQMSGQSAGDSCGLNREARCKCDC